MSVVDRREMQFTGEAVRRIVCASPRAARAIGLIGAQPASIQFLPAHGQVKVAYNDRATDRAITVSAEALGALLVSYCLRLNVPMPRFSEKSLRIEHDSVFLLFTTTYPDDALVRPEQ